MQVQRFNLVCQIAALLWMLGVIFPATLAKERHHDIAQYYMGGAMVVKGRTAALYPVPVEGATENAGFGSASVALPAYGEVAREQGLSDSSKFVYPPPAALFFVPLGLVDYGPAKVAWILLNCLAGWGVCLLALRIHAALLDRESKLSGLLCLAIACSPLMYRALRSGNITPVQTALLGGAVLGQWRRTAWASGIAVSVGGVFKGTSVVLLPLMVALRQWRALLVLTGITVLTLGVSFAVMGAEPFTVFFRDIAPTLKRSSPLAANQSALGLLRRLTEDASAGGTASQVLRGLGLANLVCLALLTLRRGALLTRSPAHFFAAAAAFLANVLIFSPLVWTHYHLYACLVWGWVLWELGQSRVGRVLGALAIGLVYLPFCLIDALGLVEPLLSHMLWGTLCLQGLAIWRLLQPLEAGAEMTEF